MSTSDSGHLFALKEFVLRPHDPAAIAGAARQVLMTACDMSYEPILDLARSFIGPDTLPNRIPELLRRITPVYLFHGRLGSARHVVSDVINVVCRRIAGNKGRDFGEEIFLLRMLTYAQHLELSVECRKAMEVIEAASRHNEGRDHEHLLFWRLIRSTALLTLEHRSDAGVELTEIFRSFANRLPAGLAAYIATNMQDSDRDNRLRIAAQLVEMLSCYAGCLMMDQRTPEALRVIAFLANSIPKPLQRSPDAPPVVQVLCKQIDVLDVFGRICSEAERDLDARKGDVDAVVSLPLWGAVHIAFFRDQVMEFWQPALEHADCRILLHVLTRAADEAAVVQCLEPLLSLPSVQLIVSRFSEAELAQLHNYEILRACHNSSVILARRADAAVFLMCADALIDRNFFRTTLSKFAGPVDALAINSLAILSRDMDVVRQLMTAPTVGPQIQMSFATFLKSVSPQTLSYITMMNKTDAHCVVPVETSHFLVLLKNRIMIFSPQLHVGALSARLLKRLSFVYGSSFDNGFVDRLCNLGLADRIYFIEDFSELRWLQLERNVVAEGWQGWEKAKPQAVPSFDMAALSGMIRQSFQTPGRMLALQRPLELTFPGNSSDALAQEHRRKFQGLAEGLIRAFQATVKPLEDDDLLKQIHGAAFQLEDASAN